MFVGNMRMQIVVIVNVLFIIYQNVYSRFTLKLDYF